MLDGDWDVSAESEDVGPYLMALGAALPGLQAGVPTTMNAKLGLAAGQVTIDDLRSTVAGQAVSGQGMSTFGVPCRPRRAPLPSTVSIWTGLREPARPVRDPSSGALAARRSQRAA